MKDDLPRFPSRDPIASENPTPTSEAPPAPTPTGESPTAERGTDPKQPESSGVAVPLVVGIALGCVGLGFLLGRWGTGPASPVPRSESTAPIPSLETPHAEVKTVTSGEPKVSPPSAHDDVVLDLGTAEVHGALHGRWTDASSGQRTAVRTTGTAGLAVAINPGGESYGIGIVGRAEAEPGDHLDVTVKLNETTVGSWKVTPDWEMYAVVVQAKQLKQGSNSIDFEFKTSDAKRAPALVLDTFHLASLNASAEADLGPVKASATLVSGYYGREGTGPDAFSWSEGKRTRVGLLLKPLNVDYELNIEGAAYGPVQPLEMKALVNGHAIGSSKVSAGPRSSFKVPAGSFVTGMNTVDLVYSRSIRPSQVNPNSKDERELAMRILRVGARPSGAP
jgi:hypothetical protein